ncbi:MAG: IclR family transcriptional regulator, partial [Ferruginibacter sp.]|nr:IclR family transcriptional regulator [Rhodoferax sp.]
TTPQRLEQDALRRDLLPLLLEAARELRPLL